PAVSTTGTSPAAAAIQFYFANSSFQSRTGVPPVRQARKRKHSCFASLGRRDACPTLWQIQFFIFSGWHVVPPAIHPANPASSIATRAGRPPPPSGPAPA